MTDWRPEHARVAAVARTVTAPAWPTLGSRCRTWEGTCDDCGAEYPPDTRILAVWSATRFWISCECSPCKWVEMRA